MLGDFATLGIGGANLKALLSILDRPHGIVLVTGPTGSGKTTTLYAALSRLNTPERKILTVEDPVEYQLEGITQIQVQPAIGLDFAGVLRSLLRHDPDVMMVGEIRDRETAEIAVQAALTGHFSPASASMSFALVAGGGAVVGVGVTWLIGRLNGVLVKRAGEEPATQILITLLMPFAAY